jgi:hypothetical protein
MSCYIGTDVISITRSTINVLFPNCDVLGIQLCRALKLSIHILGKAFMSQFIQYEYMLEILFYRTLVAFYVSRK